MTEEGFNNSGKSDYPSKYIQGWTCRDRRTVTLWFNDGSCIRLRPEHKDHVWSYDFLMARTADGRSRESILLTIDRAEAQYHTFLQHSAVY